MSDIAITWTSGSSEFTNNNTIATIYLVILMVCVRGTIVRKLLPGPKLVFSKILLSKISSITLYHRYMTQTNKNYEIYKFLKMQIDQKLPFQIKRLREQEARLKREASEVLKKENMETNMKYYLLFSWISTFPMLKMTRLRKKSLQIHLQTLKTRSLSSHQSILNQRPTTGLNHKYTIPSFFDKLFLWSSNLNIICEYLLHLDM